MLVFKGDGYKLINLYLKFLPAACKFSMIPSSLNYPLFDVVSGGSVMSFPQYGHMPLFPCLF
jgi:hypothetical protein